MTTNIALASLCVESSIMEFCQLSICQLSISRSISIDRLSIIVSLHPIEVKFCTLGFLMTLSTNTVAYFAEFCQWSIDRYVYRFCQFPFNHRESWHSGVFSDDDHECGVEFCHNCHLSHRYNQAVSITR